MVRIGIVGAGANTRARHIPGFQAIEGVTLTGVCNRSRESSQAAADAFGIERVFDTWEALVESDDVDAICIGTWPYMHHPITLRALAAGKHVLTEARMAMNLAEAREMYAAAEASDKVAMIVPAPFYLKYEATVLQMVADGVFGDWLDIHVRGLGGAYAPDAPLAWRQRRDLSGNNVMSMGIMNETVRRYAGHEASVMASGKIFTTERTDAETGERRAADVPESLGIVAELESGATAVYHFSTVAAGGDNGAIEMYGTKGAVRYADSACQVRLDGGDWAALEVEPGREGGWRVEEDFIDSIRDGAPVTHTSFADGVRYMEFTEAVRQSLVEGRRIELPLA